MLKFLYYIFSVIILGIITIFDFEHKNKLFVIVLGVVFVGAIFIEFSKYTVTFKTIYLGFLKRLITLFIISVGILIGFQIPSLHMSFFPYVILFALSVFLIIGYIEHYIIKKLENNYSVREFYTLDGMLFPYITLGICFSILIQN